MSFKVQQMKSPRIMPYAFTVLNKEYYGSTTRIHIYSWLGENFGEHGSSLWEARERSVLKFNVYFANASDAMAFRLKFT